MWSWRLPAYKDEEHSSPICRGYITCSGEEKGVVLSECLYKMLPVVSVFSKKQKVSRIPPRNTHRKAPLLILHSLVSLMSSHPNGSLHCLIHYFTQCRMCMHTECQFANRCPPCHRIGAFLNKIGSMHSNDMHA